MKITEFGVGKIIAQNTTQDVKPGETERQAKKLGLMNGKPRLLHKTAAKNSDPNTLFNLGITESVDASSLKPFVKFCIKSLELKSVPKIIITKKKLDGTFGYYDTDTKTLTVSSSDRHLADIMRTLAHELVHLAQDEQNQDIDGNDGSKHENQANAVAGVIMRKWADKDPSLFENAVNEEVKWRSGNYVQGSMKDYNEGDIVSFIDDHGKPLFGLVEKITYNIRDKKHGLWIRDVNKAIKIENPVFAKNNGAQMHYSHINGIFFEGERYGVLYDEDVSPYKVKKVYDYSRNPSAYHQSIEKYFVKIEDADEADEPVQELKIEKPDPKDTLGVKRKDMPQVKSDDYAQFIVYLKKNGATFTKETIPARELKAMQKEFSDEGILKQMMKNIEQGPNRKAVIASSDDYILDGHHRWLVAVNTGDDLNVYRVNMPAWELYELVNKFEKTYYKDIYDETRGSIGVPLASGLVMKLFPHRPLKIAKSTPGKLNYNEVSQSQDSIGAQINFPGFEKTKVKPKPKYNPVPKKDKSILDKVKGWFTDDINEAYVLRLENDDDMLVLHIRDTKSGERVEVRGKPNYEIDYDENDELHQLLDIIGKASNISELMNGKIVNINPKHPDGPKSYRAIEKVMGEEWSAKYKRSINCNNPRGFSQRAHCAGRKKNEGAEITMWTNPEYQGSDVDDEYYNKQPAKLIDVKKLTPFEPADKMDDEISAANMGKLVKAIQAGEKINPIIVVPYEGKLLIIDGHHRYFAHIKAGADKIPVVMADPKDLTWRDDVPVDEAKVDEGVNDPHIFKAVFLAGGPGSGKSFVSKNILGGTGLKTMNSDDVYEILMKKQDLALNPDTIASPQGQEIRDKAKLMTKKRSANWIDGRLGLLIDGTGKDVAKYQKQAEFLRMLGYDVAMIFVNTSEEVAQQRNRQRARSLKPEMVSAMWNDVQQNLMKFQQIFGAGRFHIIDNSGGLEDLDRQKNFDKVYNETQRFLNTPPSKPAAKKWIQNQKAQNDATQRSERTTTNNTDSDGGVRTTN
jgi:dephospho-CoA kinase